MSNSIKKISETKREIELEIPAEKVSQELEKIISQYSAKAKIKGFRPGKARKEMVKRMYYSEIKDTLINSLVPKALNKELNKHDIKPVGQPIVNELEFEEAHPLRFKAQIEVWPQVHLPDYKSIKVSKKKVSVTEEEVDQTLEDLRAKSAQYIPIEGRGVAEGDYVVAEIKGKDTQTKRFLPTEKVVILAGHPENEEALNHNIEGLKPEEQKLFTIRYKKDHDNKKLAGKEIEYELKIESIKEKKLPPVNDDFAKDLGEYKNLEDLKKHIKKQILASKKTSQKREIAEDMVRKISDLMALEIPESIIERETLALMKRQLSTDPQQNLCEEDYEKLQEQMKQRAIQNIKNHLILGKIAEKEQLDVSEKEMTEEMKTIAKSHNVSLAKVIDSINKEERREELRENLLINKAIDFLAESAIIK